jgi:hypothetical protein
MIFSNRERLKREREGEREGNRETQDLWDVPDYWH